MTLTHLTFYFNLQNPLEIFAIFGYCYMSCFLKKKKNLHRGNVKI